MHAIVKGRVQGVGFRATVRRHAIQHHLKGTVRNVSDGSVEIYVQGSQQLLDEFKQQLEKNPGLGWIESIAIEYTSPSQLFQDFCIF